MSSQPDDLAEILAAIASQEASEKLARELAAQEDTKILIDEQIAREWAQREKDEQIARNLAQSEQDAKLAREIASGKDPELDKDYAFAVQTQFELEKSRRKSLQYDIKEKSEDVSLHWERKTAAERKKITEDLQAILASAAVAGEKGTTGLTNAHKYTSTLIRAGIPVLNNIDDKFKLSSVDLTPDQVQKEVLNFLENLKKEGIDSRISIENIQKTFGYLRSNPAVEATETQANAHHLLSRTWTLAKKMGRDDMTAVATLLSDNIGDGGSCIPGLIARLYSPYAKMLAVQLGVEVSAPRSTDKATVKAK